LRDSIKNAEKDPPADYTRQQGWVLIAFHNALWQLRHAPNLEEGVVDTVMRGGDTDTNAAICGALLGAVYGLHAVPQTLGDLPAAVPPPEAGRPGVHHPLPAVFLPVDAMDLAMQLVSDQVRQDHTVHGREFSHESSADHIRNTCHRRCSPRSHLRGRWKTTNDGGVRVDDPGLVVFRLRAYT
ncbi:MAG: ADP-ribosylglycohydrolase family protein, partial [Ignavibacteriae bacterium]|nr:ADP-ribosylglycohydrolase family protein [Ignavibacteriota bacterium]